MNKKKLEIYIHIPFCIRKCAYCDFLSFPAGARVQRDYVSQLIREIKVRKNSASDYQVVSVFLGGGTPSVLKGEDIAAVMAALREAFDVSEQAEITMEANPGTGREEDVELWKKAGINRISLGLQSADDKELRYLGRIHTYADFLKTYQRVRMAGFHNINVDLISAIPGQTVESWKTTLKKVVMLKPEHISAYSLIVEEKTPYYERFGDHVELADSRLSPEELKDIMSLPDLPDEDEEREMYDLTRRFLSDQGYSRYEISNYAKPGFECRHNIGYWTGTEYLGLGLGASSYLGGWRFHNTADFKTYISGNFEEPDQMEALLRQEAEELTIQSRMEEFMFLGLRLTKGVSSEGFITRFGQNIRSVYGEVIDSLQRDGLLEQDGGYYRLTLRGLDLSNYAMSRFLLD